VTSLHLVLDTSVLLKWFHTENETEVEEAQAVREAHRTGLVAAHILDLTLYELGNVLIRSLRWSATRTADLLDVVTDVCGRPLTPPAAWRREAAKLADEYRLSFYDASYAAAAQALDAPLISTDKQLLKAGLGMSPTAFVTEHADHIRNTP
jgi:predicted nucleic acid-binding protein